MTTSADTSHWGDLAERAILGRRTGESVILTAEEGDLTGQADQPSLASGGVIYIYNMPSLEDVLHELGVITAVIERPPPTITVPTARRQPHPRGLPWQRVAAATTVAVALVVTGLITLIASAVNEPIVPNPYVALSLFVGGLVLVATLITALCGAHRTH